MLLLRSRKEDVCILLMLRFGAYFEFRIPIGLIWLLSLLFMSLTPVRVEEGNLVIRPRTEVLASMALQSE